MLNGHGDDLHLTGGQIKHNFSSNVYYKGCPKLLLKALGNALDGIQNYPSPIAAELNSYVARKYKVTENQVLFTNGATEAFYLIAQLFKGQSAAILGPTFSEYEDACKSFELGYEIIGEKDLPNVNHALVWICNPNNPNGRVFSKETLENWIQSKPNTFFVLDEAYIEFTIHAETVVALTSKYQNLIVVRSLTKTFTIPGLRLGYIVSNSKLIANLLEFKMPWSVNVMAIKAGVFIFENYKQLKFEPEILMQETEVFKTELRQFKWLHILPGFTSYFLIELKQGKANELKQYLIDNYQILIRDANNFNGLEGEFIRLAVQSKSANEDLIKAFKEWM